MPIPTLYGKPLNDVVLQLPVYYTLRDLSGTVPTFLLKTVLMAVLSEKGLFPLYVSGLKIMAKLQWHIGCLSVSYIKLITFFLKEK